MSYGLLTGDGYKHGMVKHGSKEWSYYDYRHGAEHTPIASKVSGVCSRS
jgi:transposase